MSLLSRIGYDWAVRCFGLDHCENLPLRGQRTLEECAELTQCLGLSRENAHKTIDAVYDRPVGDADQEIGGILHTVGILCESMTTVYSREGFRFDMNELHEREVRRVLKKSPEHFAKRNQEKLDLGLDAQAQSSGDVPSLTDDPHARSQQFPRTFDAYADIAAAAKARAVIGDTFKEMSRLRGQARITADRMWRNTRCREQFEKEMGFTADDITSQNYQEGFIVWTRPQVAANINAEARADQEHAMGGLASDCPPPPECPKAAECRKGQWCTCYEQAMDTEKRNQSPAERKLEATLTAADRHADPSSHSDGR